MPFSVEQFYAVFASYNEAVWPAQYFLFAVACVAVYLAALPSRTYDRIAAALLAFFWLWTGLAYHLAFFAKINPAAPLFALGFAMQAVLLWRTGVARGSLRLQLRNDLAGWTGSIAIVYALAIYPFLTAAYGHVYPQSPTFGAPCPTVIFTFGLLLWAQPAVPLALLVLPCLWALLGASAAVSLGMPPDYALPVVALASLLIAFKQRYPRARIA